MRISAYSSLNELGNAINTAQTALCTVSNKLGHVPLFKI